MRSIYARIILWSCATLVVSLAAFSIISMMVSFRSARGGPFRRLPAFQLEETRAAYEARGRDGAAAYLAKIQKYFRTDHYFTDAAGKDIITGEDRSALLALARQGQHSSRTADGRVPIAVATADGRYHMIVLVHPPISPWSLVPYYLPVLLVVALLSSLLAFSLASPLRQVARTIERFGRGDLSARTQAKRRDEIGDVARTFNQMADRIETLLTAERRLLQDISHELRSPLARLSFATELSKTAPDRRAAAARIRKEIDRLTALVSALLEVTRLEGDPSSRNLDAVAMRDLVAEIVEYCGVEAAPRGCRVQLTVRDSGVTVQGDRELLRRAIENVVRNAIRYAPEGTTIDVALEANSGTGVVSVRDYGPGVPSDALPKIFTPFFRADESRDGATGGVGLGLAIAQRAVSLHHGEIKARNANPGLEVRIEIPSAPAQIRSVPIAAR